MRRLSIATVMVALLWALPAVAHAATWAEGTPGNPFHLATQVPGTTPAVAGTPSDQALVMPYVAKVLYSGWNGSVTEPRSLEPQPDGSILVSEGSLSRVVRIDAAGSVVWHWGYSELGAWSATARGSDVIVTDRWAAGTQGRVVEIDQATGATVRSFPITPGFLEDPFFATPVGTDHTLICDGKKGKDSAGNDVPGCRVVEFDGAGNLVWWYGQLHVSGSGPDQLMSPKTAQRIPAGYVGAGNTLIDDADSYRVIEVPTVQGAAPVWQYSTSRYSPAFVPSSALRLADGTTLITDESNGRVVLLDHSTPANVLETWGVGTENRVSSSFLALKDPTGKPILKVLNQARSAVRLPSGAIAVADQGNARVVTFSYHSPASIDSAALDMGLPNVPKLFTGISWHAHGVSGNSGVSATVLYSIDSGAWVSAGTSGSFALPANAVGSSIKYRVTLATTNGASAPVLDDLTISWEPPGSPATSGSGSGTWHGSTSGSGSGSGSGTGSGTGTGTSSQAIGTVAPGGDAQIAAGVLGGSGTGGGAAVSAAGKLSGWVMTQDSRASGGGGSSGSGGRAGGTGPSPVTGALPGILLLSMAYAAGAAWPELVRLVGSLRPGISLNSPA
jgi:hypothetical protein